MNEAEQALFKRECYARWMKDEMRVGRKLRSDIEAWLKKQPDEQHMREILNGKPSAYSQRNENQ